MDLGVFIVSTNQSKGGKIKLSITETDTKRKEKEIEKAHHDLGFCFVCNAYHDKPCCDCVDKGDEENCL